MLRRIVRKIRDIIKRTSRVFKKKVPVYIPVLQSELLTGRTALITGGSSGIGLAIAKAFLQSGGNVVITGRNQEKLNKACDELKNLCSDYSERVWCIVLDNSDVSSFKLKFEQIITMLNGLKIDILVNNAGIIKGKSFAEVNEKDFTDVIDTNLKGWYFLSQIVAKYMIKNKIHGNILNVASSSSLRPAITPYTISKWGIRGFTSGLAKLLIPHDIVVNGIAPGPTATSLLISDGYDGIEHNVLPAGRYATAEEIANMSIMLVSSIGRMIVGDIIYMTGGAGTITVDDIKYNF